MARNRQLDSYLKVCGILLTLLLWALPLRPALSQGIITKVPRGAYCVVCYGAVRSGVEALRQDLGATFIPSVPNDYLLEPPERRDRIPTWVWIDVVGVELNVPVTWHGVRRQGAFMLDAHGIPLAAQGVSLIEPRRPTVVHHDQPRCELGTPRKTVNLKVVSSEKREERHSWILPSTHVLIHPTGKRCDGSLFPTFWLYEQLKRVGRLDQAVVDVGLMTRLSGTAQTSNIEEYRALPALNRHFIHCQRARTW